MVCLVIRFLILLFFFHVTDGLAPDIMHDILEGSLHYEAKELMKALVTDFKILSLNELSTRIESFPYGYSDLTNKPSFITSKILASDDNSLKQTG